MSCDIRKCEHIKTNGVRCGSPALRGESLCYFHHRAHRDFPHRAEPAPVPGRVLDIPFPEDADAIQYGLGKVIYGLLNGLIDHKSAGLVLYALQTASGNLKNTSLFKRSQKADEEDRSNVSPLLAYYLGPSREDYSRVFRILQDAEADLRNKTSEIAELKGRLGMPCEEEASADSPWVGRMREAAATEPREERYARNEDIHSAYAARRSAGLRPGGSPAETNEAHTSVANGQDSSSASSERSAKALVIHAEEDQRVTRQPCATTRRYRMRKNRLHLRCDDCANRPTQAKPGLNGAPSDSPIARWPDYPIPVPRITASNSLPFTIGSP